MNTPLRGPVFQRLAAAAQAPALREIDAARIRDGMLRRMRVTAKARFNANKRLEAKAAATTLGLQIANLYTIAIAILLLQYPTAELIEAHSRSLNYISLVASIFVQIIALLETYKDYSGKARSMHDCAIAVSRIARRLELDPRLDIQVLQQYQAFYDEAIKDYSVNHDAVDHAGAQLDPTLIRPRTFAERLRVAAWWAKYAWNVYALTAFVLLLPVICSGLLMFAGLW